MSADRGTKHRDLGTQLLTPKSGRSSVEVEALFNDKSLGKMRFKSPETGRPKERRNQ